MNQETPTTRPANRPAVRTTTHLPIRKPVISDSTKGGSSTKTTLSSDSKFTSHSTMYITLVKRTLKIPAKAPTSKANRYRCIGLPESTVAASVVPKGGGTSGDVMVRVMIRLPAGPPEGDDSPRPGKSSIWPL